MAYTPATGFNFRPAFAFEADSYTPAVQHDFARVALTVDQPRANKTDGAREFVVRSTPQTFGTFAFKTPGVFYFDGAGYAPGTGFSFPFEPAQGDSGPVIPGNNADIAGQLEGVSGTFAGQSLLPGNRGDIAGQLEGVAGIFSASYDPNVNRLLTRGTCDAKQRADFVQHVVASELTATAQRKQTIVSPKRNADANTITLHAPVDATLPRTKTTCSNVDDTTFIETVTRGELTQLIPTKTDLCGTVDETARLATRTRAAFDLLTFIWRDFDGNNEDAGPSIHDHKFAFYSEIVPGDNYQPGNAWQFIAAPDYDDGRQQQPPPEPVAFTIMGGDYTPAISFSPDYNTWPGFYSGIAPTAPPPFAWNGENAIRYRRTATERGGTRHGVEATWHRGTRRDFKRCAPVEDARRPPRGKSPWIDDPRPPYEPPPGQIPITIPERITYFMQHTITTTLEDLTPISMESVNISLDADSFAWQFNGILLDPADVALVKQTGAEPVKLIVTINGYQWKVLVEKIERSRQFSGNSIKLIGRGLSALLGKPYRQPTSANQGSDLTVQQIADLQLPIGWTNDWSAQTWLVPGGAYSHQLRTPIQAVADIARNIGAIVVPDRTAQTLHITPRYPVLPWQFDAATPDISIPESAVLSLTERPTTPAQVNGVYVHGSEIGGQIGFCRLNGTAGDKLAETQSNNLMTDPTGLRALGERILAGNAEQPAIESVTLPLDGIDVPLLDIGQLAQVTLDGNQIRGVINGITISATLNSVRQTIQLGEETPNNWTRFKALLPADPLLIATLSSTDGTTSLVTLMDGGVMRVRGTGTVNNKYYVRAGRIEGDAPNMSQSEIVI